MPLSGVKILIVDDEEGLREILVDEFAYNGAIVTAAESGNAALEILRRERFDAVISDVMMTDGDGPSLIKAINADVRPKPKLFLCTGFSALSNEQIQALNVAAVFEKPFERDHLIDTVSRALTDELGPRGLTGSDEPPREA